MSMIQNVREMWKSLFYIYINGDILLSPSTFPLLQFFYHKMLEGYIPPSFLGVGRRRDLHFGLYTLNSGTHDDLWKKGTDHPVTGIDFFIMTDKTYNSTEKEVLENIIIGRKQYDNILVAFAVINPKIYVVDCTSVLKPIHLDDCKLCKKKFIRAQKDADWNINYLQLQGYDQLIRYGFTDRVAVQVKEIPDGSFNFHFTTSHAYQSLFYLTAHNVFFKSCPIIDVNYMENQLLGKCLILTRLDCGNIDKKCIRYEENKTFDNDFVSILLYSEPYGHVLSV